MLEMSMYVILGYLSGSVLYAQVFARILKREGMIERSKDRNPGTANAFMYGGFWCGVLTLAGDLLKGFLYAEYCAGTSGGRLVRPCDCSAGGWACVSVFLWVQRRKGNCGFIWVSLRAVPVLEACYRIGAVFFIFLIDTENYTAFL